MGARRPRRAARGADPKHRGRPRARPRDRGDPSGEATGGTAVAARAPRLQRGPRPTPVSAVLGGAISRPATAVPRPTAVATRRDVPARDLHGRARPGMALPELLADRPAGDRGGDPRGDRRAHAPLRAQTLLRGLPV